MVPFRISYHGWFQPSETITSTMVSPGKTLAIREGIYNCGKLECKIHGHTIYMFLHCSGDAHLHHLSTCDTTYVIEPPSPLPVNYVLLVVESWAGPGNKATLMLSSFSGRYTIAFLTGKFVASMLHLYLGGC